MLQCLNPERKTKFTIQRKEEVTKNSEVLARLAGEIKAAHYCANQEKRGLQETEVGSYVECCFEVNKNKTKTKQNKKNTMEGISEPNKSSLREWWSNIEV